MTVTRKRSFAFEVKKEYTPPPQRGEKLGYARAESSRGSSNESRSAPSDCQPTD